MANEIPNQPAKVRRAPGDGDKPTAAQGAIPDVGKKDKLEADGDGAPSLAAPAPSVLEAVAPPAAVESPRVRRYKVWGCGTLQHDGETYAAGSEVTLSVDVAEKLPKGCVAPVGE